jgi:hypothetical protein
MRTRMGAGIAVSALAVATLATGPAAQASAGSQTSIGTRATTQNVWHRYHQPDFTVPKGQACAFKVAVHVLYDREFFRTISHYRGGAPRVQLFRGPLILQYVNVPQRTKVVRNVSGVAKEIFNRDGSFAAIKVISGHFGATLTPGSDPGRGEYYAGGQGTALFANGDGTYRLKLGPRGTAENLCPLLRG